MIIHDYDIDTEPIVNMESVYGKQRRILEKCLILYSKVIYDYLLPPKSDDWYELEERIK